MMKLATAKQILMNQDSGQEDFVTAADCIAERCGVLPYSGDEHMSAFHRFIKVVFTEYENADQFTIRQIADKWYCRF
jgi:hypothetical protein